MRSDISQVVLPFAMSNKNKNLFDIVSETTKYYNILYELYSTTFKWVNLPPEIIRDGGELYIEKNLCTTGKCLFFYDTTLKEHLVHRFTGSGLNFYEEPTRFQVTAPNGYSQSFDRTQAVPIYNSPNKSTELNTIQNFAMKLAMCDLTIMLNVNSQKMPYLIKAKEGQRLSLINVMKKMDEFEEKIFVDNEFDENSLKILELNSPYISGQLYDLKSQYWQEALKFLGIGTGTVKKERVNLEEQLDSQGESNALLFTRLASRQVAAQQINDMFNLDVQVEVREDLENRQKMVNDKELDKEYDSGGEE